MATATDSGERRALFVSVATSDSRFLATVLNIVCGVLALFTVGCGTVREGLGVLPNMAGQTNQMVQRVEETRKPLLGLHATTLTLQQSLDSSHDESVRLNESLDIMRDSVGALEASMGALKVVPQVEKSLVELRTGAHDLQDKVEGLNPLKRAVVQVEVRIVGLGSTIESRFGGLERALSHLQTEIHRLHSAFHIVDLVWSHKRLLALGLSAALLIHIGLSLNSILLLQATASPSRRQRRTATLVVPGAIAARNRGPNAPPVVSNAEAPTVEHGFQFPPPPGVASLPVVS